MTMCVSPCECVGVVVPVSVWCDGTCECGCGGTCECGCGVIPVSVWVWWYL